MRSLSMLLVIVLVADSALAQLSSDEAQQRLEERQRRREAAKPYAVLEAENRKLHEENARLSSEVVQLRDDLARAKQELSRHSTFASEMPMQLSALKDEVARLRAWQRDVRAASGAATRPGSAGEHLHADLKEFADRFAKEVARSHQKKTGSKRDVRVDSTDLKRTDSLVHPVVGIVVLTEDVHHPNTERPVRWTYSFTFARDEAGAWKGVSATSRLEDAKEEDLPISWYAEVFKAVNGTRD